MLVTEIAEISQADYNELNSLDSRWTIDEYAYWVAKFKRDIQQKDMDVSDQD